MGNQLIEILFFERGERDFSRLRELVTGADSSDKVPPDQALLKMEAVSVTADGLALLDERSFDVLLVSEAYMRKGQELFRELSTKVPTVPVIVLCTEYSRELPLKIKEFGVEDFLVLQSLSMIQLECRLFMAMEKAKVLRVFSEESQHKSQFLARMSHEIRTPITAILGFAEVILEQGVTLEDQRSAGHTILRNSKFLLGIIDDILDFSRIESGRLKMHVERVSLFEILQDFSDLIRPRAERKGLRFDVQPLFPLPSLIHTDAIRLEQILVNLAGNAVKFCEKGTITVSVHWVPETSKLVFHVKDTGIGIERRRLESLFDPFVQADDSIRRKFGGTGLGLAISRSLVEALGGEISASSTPGVGSDFSFMVDAGAVGEAELVYEAPKVEENAERPELFVMRAGGSIRGSVLIAEDVKDTQDLLAFYLKRAGATCTVVSNGADAVRVASEREFDLILMDMQMPVMDGFEAVRWLRTQGYSRPIVALTASATEETRNNCLAVGCDEHLTKPFSRDIFIGKIRAFLPRLEGETLESRLETFRTDPSYLDLVDKFRFGLPDRLMALSHAMEANQPQKVRELAHRLASAEMFGFERITKIARRLEDASIGRHTEQMKAFFIELSEAVKAAVLME